jgi:hypothetical protein
LRIQLPCSPTYCVRPVVEEADKIAPGFSRIYKEMIIFSTDEKPLPRVGKGTIARKAAIALYSSEIDQMSVLSKYFK